MTKKFWSLSVWHPTKDTIFVCEPNSFICSISSVNSSFCSSDGSSRGGQIQWREVTYFCSLWLHFLFTFFAIKVIFTHCFLEPILASDAQLKRTDIFNSVMSRKQIKWHWLNYGSVRSSSIMICIQIKLFFQSFDWSIGKYVTTDNYLRTMICLYAIKRIVNLKNPSLTGNRTLTFTMTGSRNAAPNLWS